MFCVFVAKGGQFAGHTFAIRQTTLQVQGRTCPEQVEAVVTIQSTQQFVQGTFQEKRKDDLEEKERLHTIAYGTRPLYSELVSILQNVVP